MLDLKVVGWGPPNKPSSRRVELFADWIEAQSLISGVGQAIEMSELADRLSDNTMVSSEDDAWTLIADAKKCCKRRQRALGHRYPFAVAGDAIEHINPDELAYIFCLLVSLPEQFTILRTGLDVTFRDMFEEVVAAAVVQGMADWTVYSTGWAALAGDDNAKKGAIVRMIAEWVQARKFDQSVFPNANDAQVDIAIMRHFADNRYSFPVILGQCATGVTNWKDKAIRPNLDRWGKAVQFSSTPTKLFAVPFALDDDSFWEIATECSGVILERVRICSLVQDLPAELRVRIQAWVDRFLPALPLAA